MPFRALLSPKTSFRTLAVAKVTLERNTLAVLPGDD
jgi:hypothetical protein